MHPPGPSSISGSVPPPHANSTHSDDPVFATPRPRTRAHAPAADTPMTIDTPRPTLVSASTIQLLEQAMRDRHPEHDDGDNDDEDDGASHPYSPAPFRSTFTSYGDLSPSSVDSPVCARPSASRRSNLSTVSRWSAGSSVRGDGVVPSAVAKYQSEIAELQEKLRAKEAEVLSLRNEHALEVDSLRSTVTQLQKDFATTTARCSTLDEQRKFLFHKKTKLEKDAQDLRAELEQAKSREVSTTTRLETQLEELQAKCQHLEREAKRATHAETQHMQLIQSTIEVQDKEITQVQGRNEALARENRALLQKLSAVEAKYETLHAEHVKTKKEALLYGGVSAQRNEVLRNVQYMTDLETKNTALTAEVARLRDRQRATHLLEEEKLALSQKLKGMDELRHRVVALEAERDELRTRLGAWATVPKSPTDVLAELDSVKMQLARKTEELKVAKENVQTAMSQRDQVNAMLAKAKAQTKEADDKYWAEHANHLKYKRMAADFERNANELRTQLQEMADEAVRSSGTRGNTAAAAAARVAQLESETARLQLELTAATAATDAPLTKKRKLDTDSTASAAAGPDQCATPVVVTYDHPIVTNLLTTVTDLFGYTFPALSDTQAIVQSQTAAVPDGQFVFARAPDGHARLERIQSDEYRAAHQTRMSEWTKRKNLTGFLAAVKLAELGGDNRVAAPNSGAPAAGTPAGEL
ncbi:coiled-coil domain-containing protein mad1 [Allomyces arbusculus]|nr:coiled-coil domain-containing protein mad1 [Allomyces arbusculus]